MALVPGHELIDDFSNAFGFTIVHHFPEALGNFDVQGAVLQAFTALNAQGCLGLLAGNKSVEHGVLELG